jgi:MscS family membrane protein
VTIPNSVMAKEKIDNMGVRPSRRIRHVLGITYDTSTERLTGFMDALKYTLHQHPLILKDDIRVYFNNMGDFNLQILVQFFIAPGTAQEELQIQQEVLLEIMNIAQKLDVSFAFPTQTIHIENLQPQSSL